VTLATRVGISVTLMSLSSCANSLTEWSRAEAGQARGVDKLLKDGDWNRFRLEAMGDSFSVWLNGDKVANYTNATFAAGGPIGLQIHPDLKMKVEFRNIRAKALE
jgi:hypothetical protein